MANEFTKWRLYLEGKYISQGRHLVREIEDLDDEDTHKLLTFLVVDVNRQDLESQNLLDSFRVHFYVDQEKAVKKAIRGSDGQLITGEKAEVPTYMDNLSTETGFPGLEPELGA